MDASTVAVIASVIIAIVAIIPGTMALVSQSKKDAKEANLNMTTAAQNAAMSMIGPLQAEVARLQARVIELENALIAKTTQIGTLMQENIDKDSRIRTLQYSVEGMQQRLDTFEVRKTSTKNMKASADIKDSSELSAQTHKEEDFITDEEKKQKIALETEQEVQYIKSTSVAGGTFLPAESME